MDRGGDLGKLAGFCRPFPDADGPVFEHHRPAGERDQRVAGPELGEVVTGGGLLFEHSVPVVKGRGKADFVHGGMVVPASEAVMEMPVHQAQNPAFVLVQNLIKLALPVRGFDVPAPVGMPIGMDRDVQANRKEFSILRGGIALGVDPVQLVFERKPSCESVRELFKSRNRSQ